MLSRSRSSSSNLGIKAFPSIQETEVGPLNWDAGSQAEESLLALDPGQVEKPTTAMPFFQSSAALLGSFGFF